MENYLFLFEVFVETIHFSSKDMEFLKHENIRIQAAVGKFIKMEIVSVYKQVRVKVNDTIYFNSGKSILFPSTPEQLVQNLQRFPLIIKIYNQQQLVGLVSIPWTDDFLDLVKQSPANFGVIGPVSVQDNLIFHDNETKLIMGDIKVTVRLSSHGDSIQTSFQLVAAPKTGTKRFLIKGTRQETTFECRQFGTGTSSDILPITPLFNETEPRIGEISMTRSFNPTESISWMALFKSNLEPRYSVAPDEFNIAIATIQDPDKQTISALTFDIVSMIERPEENKFMDLRIKGGSQGFVLDIEAHQRSVSEEVRAAVDKKPLTKEEILERLCKKKDCPAAKKFKEHGIGPLATINGMGVAFTNATPSVSYGLTQTYGVFDEYGPYGLFLRSQKPESKSQKGCQHHSPLRLTGGGMFDYDDVKSPLHECKEIMNQLDEVVHQYKQALGPCGKTTCPFAPNVTQEACNNICPGPKHQQATQPAAVQSIEILPKLITKSTVPDAACGLPGCPYAKYKTQLLDEDAMMELQFLPPAVSGTCGDPKCPYPVGPKLPPIHWDCPDPLPKGRCINPDCPHLPKEIKCLNEVMYNKLCNNKNCPYTVPPPCLSPTCPFATKECPYQGDASSICDNPNCEYGKQEHGSICENPECPYAAQKKPSPCYQAGDAVTCPASPKICFGGPDCPYTKSGIAPPPFPYMINPCLQNVLAALFPQLAMCFGGPECPLKKKSTQPDESNDEICDNPECPYRESTQNQEDICDNPKCPFKQAGTTERVVVTRDEVDNAPCPCSKSPEGDEHENTSTERIIIDNVPCTPATCKAGAGNLVCEECKDEEKIEIVRGTRKKINNAPCTPKSCRSTGGKLVCEECPCGVKRKKRKGKRSKFVYHIGDKYPGVQIGHRECVTSGPMVPSKMGWLWNIFQPCMQLKPRRGWRPGAIAKTIAERIKQHRAQQGIDILRLPKFTTRVYKEGAFIEETGPTVEPKPTLQIKKRDGCYWITMNPLKDPNSLVENENPYMDCTPLQFKIVKSKKEKEEQYFSCFCDEDEEKKSPSSSSSDSELDIEFTPPAGIIHPERFKKKRNVVHCDTQYLVTDFEKPKSSTNVRGATSKASVKKVKKEKEKKDDKKKGHKAKGDKKKKMKKK